MRRFYSPPEHISQGKVELGPEETRHLRDVLRLSIGDEASVFDGVGNEYRCMVEVVSKTAAVLEVLSEIEPSSPESPLEITVAAAILPGEKYEITVQKAVELGVYRLQPLYSKRCEVKPGESTRRMERWRKIAIESAKQSGRATLMEILEPVGFANLITLSQESSTTESYVLFSERDGEGFENIVGSARMTAVFGPKGGWEDEEVRIARDAGFQVITFGGRIMRAETAAIAMTAILQHRFGDLF